NSGTVEGQADGANATHCQPTSCCTEMNTIFLCDTAVGKVKMITHPIGLLQYLEKLSAFLKVFGVHKRGEPRNKIHRCSAEEATKILEDVCTFFKTCEREVREFITTERSLQGPDGVCSIQTMRDLDLTLKTVRNIVALIKKVSPNYLDSLDLSSLTILVVENLFAEMREGNDMPLAIQFAYRLSSTVREHLKRNTKCSFNYYTSSSSYYPMQNGFLPFSKLPTMPKPERNHVTKTQLAEMRKWRAEFGQSVRQVTVRNKSTKDNPGTLPINCYAAKPSQPRPVNFLQLEMTAEQEQQSLQNAQNPLLFMKNCFVVIKPGFQPTHLPQAPFYLGRCTADVKSSERRAQVAIYRQDFLLPFHFVYANVVYLLDLNGVSREIQSSFAEEDIVVMEEETILVV
ncbi:Hypothetical predicted protein, partial [Paramuricea clavata]